MELPESLEKTYERIVKDIKKVNHADSYRMLQCLAVAIRPLSVAELAEVLAFDFDASTTKDGIPNSTQNGGGTIMNKPYFQHALVWSLLFLHAVVRLFSFHTFL